MPVRKAYILKRGRILLRHSKTDKIRDSLDKFPKLSYDGKNSWEIELSLEAVQELKRLNFDFSKNLQRWFLKESRKKLEKRKIKIKKIPGLKGKLYPFQLEGVNFIENNQGRVLIADEMGLGKTVQALAWLQLNKDKVKPVIIICPGFLKLNWSREIKKWTSEKNIQILSGQTPYPISGNIILINYEILHYWKDDLLDTGFKTIIIDECHFVKNKRAKRTKAFKKLSKSTEYLIALSGTPIESKPIDIYNIVYAIDSSIFPSYMNFTLDFCDAKKNGFGWDVSGASNTIQLNHILSRTIMIRRKKKDVLKYLPPKQFVKIPLQINNLDEYKKAENEFVSFLKELFENIDIDSIDEELENKLRKYAKDHDIEVGDDLTEQNIEEIKDSKMRAAKKNAAMKIDPLKQLAAKGKMDEVINWIEDFLESGEKLVVFTFHKKVIKKLTDHFKNAVSIEGSTSNTQRQKNIDAFQNNPNVKLFIGQIKAAGVGSTLTAASNVAVVQYPWNPGTYHQACDRVHRITQLKQVTIWNLVAENTIEEKIIDILIKKEKTSSEVLDGKRSSSLSVLSELINELKK